MSTKPNKPNTEEVSTTIDETAISEVSQPAEGSITYNTYEETPDTVIGRIITLGPNSALWRTEHNGIELSFFTGNITANVSADLSLFEREQVVSGLRAGSIVYAHKEQKLTPSRLMYDDSSEAIKARIFLDNPNLDVFKKELATIRSREFIERCIVIYETEYRTTARLQLLKSQLEKL